MHKLIAGLVPVLLALGAAPLAVQEWTVPWDGTRPRDPYVAGSGLVWFVGQEGNYIAHLDPRTGKFERYDIEAGTHPHNLVVAPDGMVWFTGNRNGRLVKLNPAARKLTNYPMPDGKADDPHTMVLDRAGNAWFTAQNSAVVGRLDAKSGKVRLWETGAGTRPYGIELDAQQRPWYVLFGTNQVGTIDPGTMKERRFDLPEGTRARRLVVRDDAIWYGDYARGYLGRLDRKTGKVEEFTMPGKAASLPYAMAGDDKGKIWLAETGVRPNRLVAFDPGRRKFTDSVATEGGEAPNTIRHMVFHKPTREIWYGTDRNTVGRLGVP
ncbi:MAG: lyase [Gemmatimonadales bacterium]|nr:lyase [Gemmatimonadales bacterium]